MNNVTIVIPVYGNPELVVRAVDSVVRFGSLNNNKLIVVDDCGPDSDQIREIVDEARRSSANIEYFANDKNVGFVKTCNRAVFELDETSNDVLLLNSDAELTDGALAELQAVLYFSSQHACVTPRTNHGTIATIPFYSRRDRSDDEAFQFFRDHRTMLPRFSVAPVSPGFCMLIRRDVIRVHGLFDPIFSPGYDEENDFCLRVNSVGLSSVLANHAFVFHRGSTSFGSERQLKLSRAHSKLLNKRYPFYPQLLANYFAKRIDPIDKFLDYLKADSTPSILIDCTALFPMINGTVTNVLSFVDFVSTHSRFLENECTVTLLASRAMVVRYRLARFGFRIAYVEDSSDDLFDVGFAVSPIWTLDSLERLVSRCARVAVLHLDIIAVRTWELNSADFTREHAVYAAAEWADLTIFISESARNDFTHFRAGAPIRDQRVIPQGLVNRPRIASDDTNHEAATVTTSPTNVDYSFRSPDLCAVFVVGNGFKHKQVELAVDALRQPAFEVISLGGEDKRVGNATLIHSGALAEGVIHNLFQQSDVVVFPSAYEGFGLPIAEALQAGKPLVVFDTPTAREVVAIFGGADRVVFFSDFALLGDAVELALGFPTFDGTTEMRSSDHFNSEIFEELLALASHDVDTDFLGRRQTHFRGVSPSLPSRRSTRWANAVADVAWGRIQRMFFHR
jgi:GT2 family glycosyltransferase